MAIIAGEYNFTVQRRADHDENITLQMVMTIQ